MLSPPAPLLAVLFHSTCSGILAVLADPTQGPRTQAACAQALFVTCYHLRETTVADESIADIVGVCVQMLTTATSPDSTNAARSTAGRGACVASKSPASTAVARIGAVKVRWRQGCVVIGVRLWGCAQGAWSMGGGLWGGLGWLLCTTVSLLSAESERVCESVCV